MFRIIFAAFLLCLAPGAASADPASSEDLQEVVDRTRDDNGLIALGAVVANADGEILGLAVSGERVKGSGDAARPGDAWHIGSNTKMLTALMYGRLVEQGRASWGATLPELFPDLAKEMDPAWQDVTVEQLLSHRSGLAANPGMMWFLTARGSKSSHADQRTALASSFLSKPPANTTGEFVYSNLGFMIAGAAIDRIAAEQGYEDYEALFLADFVPAGEGWGFGPPRVGIEGHSEGLFGGLKGQGKGPGADNPPALAPAGTAHVPLAAHARFISQFLRPDETIAKLLTPVPDKSSDYALGIGMYDSAEHGRVYTHNGSNTMWLSSVTIAPEAGLVVIVNTNQFGKKDPAVLRSLTGELLELYADAAEGE